MSQQKPILKFSYKTSISIGDFDRSPHQTLNQLDDFVQEVQTSCAKKRKSNMLKSIKYWMDHTDPSTQELVISTLCVIVIGLLISVVFAIYHPSNWLSAVALVCSLIGVGLSVQSYAMAKN